MPKDNNSFAIKLIQNERLRLYEQSFEEKFLDKINYLILATDDKDLHKAVSELARKKGIIVNDASCKENCDFYFPSIIDKDELISTTKMDYVGIKDIKSEKIFRVLVISVEIRRENYAGKIR